MTITAVQELRALVATYLEGSDDALRATALLDAIDVPPPPTEPVTADTITDDQIRELLRSEPEWLTSLRQDANDALSDREPFRAHARMRLTGIYNATSRSTRTRRASAVSSVAAAQRDQSADVPVKLTKDQIDAAWKIVQEKYDRGEIDISLTDTFNILWAAQESKGCELAPLSSYLTPTEVQRVALEIIREHAPQLVTDPQNTSKADTSCAALNQAKAAAHDAYLAANRALAVLDETADQAWITRAEAVRENAWQLYTALVLETEWR